MPTATTTIRAGETSPDAGHTGRTHQSGGGCEAVATGGALVACIVGHLPHHVVDAVGIRAWGLALVVAVAVVSGVRAVVRAPFTLRRSLHADSDRPGALRRWARTEATTVVVTTVAGTAVTLPLYLLLRTTTAWWLPAGLLAAAVTVIWQLVMPLTIAAQAGPLTPAPAPLGDRVRALAALAGVTVGDGVVVAGKPGARRCNAYVVGLGRTRRVVLESAVAAWPPHLLDQVVAHELGHWRLGHTARRLPLTLACQLGTLAAAAAVLSFRPLLGWAAISGAGDPRSYPLLLAVGIGVGLPARCLLAWRDRSQERAADHFALDLLDRPDHFVAMLHRAADESGVPLRLPWWRQLTASHPPVNERILAVLAKGT